MHESKWVFPTCQQIKLHPMSNTWRAVVSARPLCGASGVKVFAFVCNRDYESVHVKQTLSKTTFICAWKNENKVHSVLTWGFRKISQKLQNPRKTVNVSYSFLYSSKTQHRSKRLEWTGTDSVNRWDKMSLDLSETTLFGTPLLPIATL